MVADKKEKLQKLIEQIGKENEIIARARANIRRLNAQKKKLEKESLRNYNNIKIIKIIVLKFYIFGNSL